MVLLTIALIVYNYIYKNHRNISTETPSFVVESTSLLTEFTSNMEMSSKKYLDKTIEITGLVTTVHVTSLEIEQSISCYFKDTIVNNKLLNNKIIIKGRCIGFDELLERIKMDQCVIITK